MGREIGFAIDPQWGILLRDLGVDLSAVLSRAGLPADLLARPGSRISATSYYRLWEAVEMESGSALVPLRFGELFSAESFAPPLFAALCSPNLRIAARRISRYKPLIGPLRILCHDLDEAFRLQFLWPDEPGPPPSGLALTELVFFVRLARMATREQVVPLRIQTNSPPADREAYREFFGCFLVEADSDSILFSREDAERPFLTRNAAMWNTFEPELRRRLQDLDANAAVAERVRSLLLEFLPSGRSSIELVSEQLMMSKRTLQRRLSAEGTSYQGLLRGVREELASHYLLNSTLSASEISYLLGFEDANSFFRAFGEWTGSTPEAVRRTGELASASS